METHKRDKKNQRRKKKRKSIPKRKRGKNKYAHHRAHGPFGCLLFTLINITAWITINIFLSNNLPTPLPESVESFQFSEERALLHLQKLASFGIRTVGSYANEIRSPHYIINYIHAINETLHERHKNNRNESYILNNLEMDIQKVSGAFSLNFLGGFVNKYENHTNILIRISNPNRPETLNNAILISAHYDTAIGCSGVSDDGINIAIMMELVRNLLLTQHELNIAVVLNFNGGEESVLPAAHGFITRHKWSSSIKMFINLEASGAGGAELLFQVSAHNGWLIDAYMRSAAHPYGHSVGTVIFSSGAIPGLTDFTVYSQYAKNRIVGLDFAFTENGYVYHTAQDDADELDVGSLQHCGDNMLSLIHTLNTDARDDNSYFSQFLSNKSASNWLDHLYMNSNYVFYDLFGFFMIGYPYSIAIGGHCIMFILFLYVFITQYWSKTHVIQFTKRIIIANICGIIVAAGIGVFTFSFQRLAWYSYPYMCILIYGIPCIAVIILTHHCFHIRSKADAKLSILQIESYLIAADALCWYTSLMLMSLFMVGISMISLFWCLSFLIILYVRIAWLNASLLRKYQWIYDVAHCVSLILPLLTTHFLWCKLLHIFVPVMGRSGDTVPADIVISILIAVCACMACSGGLPFIYRLHTRSRLYICVALGLLTLISLIMNSTNNVYGVKTPKRVYLQSATRHWHNGSKDAGLWVNALDSLVLEPMKNIGIDVFDSMEYETYHIDEHAWFYPMADMFTQSLYIDGDYDELSNMVPKPLKTSIEMINQSYADDEDTLTAYFVLKGPSHHSMTLNTSLLIDWSFNTSVHRKTHAPTFVFISSGLSQDIIPLEDEHYYQRFIDEERPVSSETVFWFKISAKDIAAQGKDGFVFTVSGHHVNGAYSRNKNKEMAMRKYNLNIPDWVDPIWFLSEFFQVKIDI